MERTREAEKPVVGPEYFKYLKSLGQQIEWINPEVKWLIEKMELSADGISEILHQVAGVETDEEVSMICQNALARFDEVRLYLVSIQSLIPKGLYHKYRYKIRYVMERLMCFVSYITFLCDANFMDAEGMAKFFGVEYTEEDTLFDLETYLVGLLHMADELSQLCVMDVTNGRYNRLTKIVKFLKEINEGFSLLNFKNDFLRRKYDSLKYCIREVETANDDVLMHGLKMNEVVETETKV